MRILITGGFGYVGGRLGMHLASTPRNHVYLGSRVPRKMPDWLHQGGVITMDWSDKSSLLSACKNMDVIIHAAGSNAADCLTNPTLALTTNVRATERLLEAALKRDVSKLIYLSTAHVYASQLSGLITEDTQVLNLHPYATSHVAKENLVINEHSGVGLQSVIVRMANSFGAPAYPDTNCWMLVINDLCRQATVDQTIAINGPSNVVRNFISMTDVCLALEYLILDREIRQFPLICNLGGLEQTIFEMAGTIKKLFAKRTNIILPIYELSPPDPSATFLNFRSLVLEEMGLKTSSNLRDEISNLIEFCELNFKRKNAR